MAAMEVPAVAVTDAEPDDCDGVDGAVPDSGRSRFDRSVTEVSGRRHSVMRESGAAIALSRPQANISSTSTLPKLPLPPKPKSAQPKLPFARAGSNSSAPIIGDVAPEAIVDVSDNIEVPAEVAAEEAPAKRAKTGRGPDIYKRDDYSRIRLIFGPKDGNHYVCKIGAEMAGCKHLDRVAQKSAGTDNLITHCEINHSVTWSAVKAAPSVKEATEIVEKAISTANKLRTKNEAFFKGLAKMAVSAMGQIILLSFAFITGGISFAFIENIWFQAFLSSIGFDLFSTSYLSTVIYSLCHALSVIRQKGLQGVKYVSCTADSWTDIRNRRYVGITAHWVDDKFVSHSCFLDAIPLSSAHTGITLATLIWERIESEFDKDCMLVAITLDNGANFQLAGKNIVGKENVIPCLAHTLQLSIFDCLDMPEVARDIATISNVVSCIRSSPKILGNFRVLSDLDLVQSNATRWDSTCNMIERAVDLNKVLLDLQESLGNFESWKLTHDLFVCLRSYYLVLKNVREMTKMVQGHILAAQVPTWIKKLLDSLVPNPLEDTVSVATFRASLHARVYHRLGWILTKDNIFLRCAALDHRFGRLSMVSSLDVRDAVWSSLREEEKHLRSAHTEEAAGNSDLCDSQG